MPELWHYIAGYASALLVSSRNEGDHRTLEVKAQAALGTASPAYLCARLRQENSFAATELPAFRAFAQRLWNRRGSREMSAMMCSDSCSVAQVVRLTLPEKLKHIYQLDISEQFADTTAANEQIAAHRSVEKLHAVQAIATTVVENLCVFHVEAYLVHRSRVLASGCVVQHGGRPQ